MRGFRNPTNTPTDTLVIARVLMSSQAHPQKNVAANEAMRPRKQTIVSDLGVTETMASPLGVGRKIHTIT